MSKPTVVLFDIDGTLITTGGAGRRAMERAFAARGADGKVFANIVFGGMTDPAIIRAGLRLTKGEMKDMQPLLDAYVAALKEELVLSRAEHRLHAGMAEAVAMLRARPNTAVGLGTGNVISGAEAKLAPLGAYQWFDFGGFGSDHEDRHSLIEIGFKRGKDRLGVSDARLIIVGDTPHDVHAAKRNGGTCVCVTTGNFDAARLRAAGADHVFTDLTVAGSLDTFA